MESLFLIIVLFVILLIVIPVNYSIGFNYDPYKNKGVFGIKFLFFRFRIAIFKIKGLGIEIKNKGNKKATEVQIVLDPEQFRYIKNLINQFKNKLKIKTVHFFSKVGAGDAFTSAMLSGAVLEIICVICAYLKNFKQTGPIEIGNKTEFNEKIFKLNFRIKISVSLFDLLYSFAIAKIKNWRNKKYERNRKQKLRRKSA